MRKLTLPPPMYVWCRIFAIGSFRNLVCQSFVMFLFIFQCPNVFRVLEKYLTTKYNATNHEAIQVQIIYYFLPKPTGQFLFFFIPPLKCDNLEG